MNQGHEAPLIQQIRQDFITQLNQFHQYDTVHDLAAGFFPWRPLVFLKSLLQQFADSEQHPTNEEKLELFWYWSYFAQVLVNAFQVSPRHAIPLSFRIWLAGIQEPDENLNHLSNVPLWIDMTHVLKDILMVQMPAWNEVERILGEHNPPHWLVQALGGWEGDEGEPDVIY